MRKLLLSCCTLALLAAPMAAMAQTEPATATVPSVQIDPALFQAQDLFGLEVGTNPQISPDGSRIIYVRQTADIMSDRMRSSLWQIDVRTGEQTPLVAGPGAHMQPQWSPDGKRLAYISTAEGGGAQLYVRWMEGGQTVRVTNLPSTPNGIRWSPDGTRIAYSMLVPSAPSQLGNTPAKPEGAQWAPGLEVIDRLTYRVDGAGYLKPGYSHIFVVSADGGGPRQLTSGDFHHGSDLSWSSDGRSLYFSANRSPNWQHEPDSEIYSLDVATNTLTALTHRKGPDASPTVSPDGRLIAYIGFDDQRMGYHNARLSVMNTDGSSTRVLTQSLDRSVDQAIWSADSRSLLISYEDHGSTTVSRVSLDGRITPVIENLTGSDFGRPYAGGDFSVARDGTLAFTRGTPARPADIHLSKQGRETQLTRLNSESLGHKRLGKVERLEVASSHDGQKVESWLTYPANYVEGQSYPLILEIHGGPFAAYGPHFSTDNQLFAAAGYAVLSVNPRGSTSYGADFANLIHHKYPGNDYDDLISSVDAVIAKGVADSNRLFVTGGSGGGVLTSWIVGKTNRFKAAATQKPVINWTSFALTADMPAYFTRYWFESLPWETPQTYWDRSPLSLVGKVETPTMVIVGDQDFRTPVSESEQYYTALRLRGVPTTLVKIPGVGHGFAARPSQSAARISAILTWFDRYKDGAPPHS